MIHIKVGNVASQLEVNPEVINENLIKHLRKYLRVRPDGYHRVNAFKKGHWDGYKYFITPGGKFASGFLPMIYNYLVDYGYADTEIWLEDNRVNIPKFIEERDDYVGNINGQDWTVRGYQKEAVDTIISNVMQGLVWPRGIVDAATNAGKNSITSNLIWNLEEDTKVLFLLHNKTLLEQQYQFFVQCFGDKEVGVIKSGTNKPGRVTVAMCKTLLNLSKKDVNTKRYLGSIGMVLVDEGHRAGGDTYTDLLQRIDAGSRLIISGTPLENEDPIKNVVLTGHTGKTLFKVTNKELFDEGVSLKPVVKILRNKEDDGAIKYNNWAEEEYDRIVFSKNRLQHVKDILEEYSDCYILLAVNRIAHGEFLMEELSKDSKRVIDFVHGTSANRLNRIDNFIKGRTDVLIGSTILKEGLNIPNIQVLVYLVGGKTTVGVKQTLGRGMRKSDTELDDKGLTVFDFFDEGEHTSLHSRMRIKIYKNEEFDVELCYKANRYGTPL